jgi:hypothetical protein
VILTNVNDAAETAAALLADRAADRLSVGGDGAGAVREHLAGQDAPVLGFDSWGAINTVELERGKAASKVREKVVRIDEMLQLGTQAS